MSRKLLVGFMVAALAAAALASATTAGAATRTKLTISAQEGGFSGFVISALDKCHNGRKVTLYKKKGTKPRPKKDKRIGTDVATPNGDGSQWRIDTDQRGKFYAYVSRSKGCGAAYSKVKAAAPRTQEG
jgi:hypothetical protein